MLPHVPADDLPICLRCQSCNFDNDNVPHGGLICQEDTLSHRLFLSNTDQFSAD